MKKTKNFKSKKSVVKKTVKKTILNNTNSTITETLKKKVLPYIINDIINACHNAKLGQSIRIGKLGRIKKTRRQGTVNGHAYKVNSYSFKAYSVLKNN